MQKQFATRAAAVCFEMLKTAVMKRLWQTADFSLPAEAMDSPTVTPCQSERKLLHSELTVASCFANFVDEMLSEAGKPQTVGPRATMGPSVGKSDLWPTIFFWKDVLRTDWKTKSTQVLLWW